MNPSIRIAACCVLGLLVVDELSTSFASVSTVHHAFRGAYTLGQQLPLLAGLVSLALGRREAPGFLLGSTLMHGPTHAVASLGLVFLAASLAMAPSRPASVMAGAAMALGVTVLMDDALVLRNLLQRYADGPEQPFIIALRIACCVFVLRRIERAAGAMAHLGTPTICERSATT